MRVRTHASCPTVGISVTNYTAHIPVVGDKTITVGSMRGNQMNKDALWTLFWRTGNAVFYALYKSLEKTEEKTA